MIKTTSHLLGLHTATCDKKVVENTLAELAALDEEEGECQLTISATCMFSIVDELYQLRHTVNTIRNIMND